MESMDCYQMKDVYKIKGGNQLSGIIKVDGGKNSAVALIAASILANSIVELEGLPDISDVLILKKILEEIGGEVTFEEGKMTINSICMVNMPLPNGNVKKLRASYYMMGAMLGRFKHVVIGLPGGCFLGGRPIDQHIKGFKALGARVMTPEPETIYLCADKLHGARICLDVVSVGATINIMLAAVLAKGQTVIENAAKEPEIVDVACLLIKMGAKIKGAGTSIISINGVQRLDGTKHMVMPDRIEAGTFMIMAATVGDGIRIDNVIPSHMEALIAKLCEMGVEVQESKDSIFIPKSNNLKAINIETSVYPGFATDLQQPFSVLMTQAKGSSTITDKIYPRRFKHIDELCSMNASCRMEGGKAIITGPTVLTASCVIASDLRAGAALVIAGLLAEGETEIHEIHHIERGYSKLIEKLQGLGANICKERRLV